jgi:hypothetical protein
MQVGEQVSAKDDGSAARRRAEYHGVEKRVNRGRMRPGMPSPNVFRRGCFLPGVNGRKASIEEARRKQDELMARWCQGAGVELSTLHEAELSMLRNAAQLALLRPPANPDRRVRIANSISRTLVTLGLVERHSKLRAPVRREASELLLLGDDPHG